MKIVLFVHELLPQVGHSRAMIELMNGLTPEQKNQVESIEAVCCESQDLNQLFPEFKCTKKITIVPGKNFKPFILKMFSYHLFSSLYCLFKGKGKIKIGIGIACLNVDISNIQFIHEQWKDPFFKRRMNFIPYLYKKLLFKYFEIGENILFKNKKRHFIVIADFLKDFIKERFGTDAAQFTSIPSGVNSQEFSLPSGTQEEIFNNLKIKYPELNNINPSLPVALFVGAFERKGLDRVLKYLSDKKNQQLILIGKPESFTTWTFPKDITMAYIPFTKEVQLFYAIADIFIFPTYYEPFGLVILEAYAMGLDLIVPRDNVGASEILKESEGIYFFDQNQDLPDVQFRKLSREDKLSRRAQRMEVLAPFTWKNGAQKFYSILSRY